MSDDHFAPLFKSLIVVLAVIAATAIIYSCTVHLRPNSENQKNVAAAKAQWDTKSAPLDTGKSYSP